MSSQVDWQPKCACEKYKKRQFLQKNGSEQDSRGSKGKWEGKGLEQELADEVEVQKRAHPVVVSPDVYKKAH